MADQERYERVQRAVTDAGFDALVCGLPENVRLLTGYWPVVGASLAVVTPHWIAVIAPEDEADLASLGFADRVVTYKPGSLHRLTSPAQAIRDKVHSVVGSAQVLRIGLEDGAVFEPSPYAAAYLFPTALPGLLSAVAPGATVSSAAGIIARLRSRLTESEVETERLACVAARRAFGGAASRIRSGLRESDVAALFHSALEVEGLAAAGEHRAGAFVWCMSGPNSALAGAAYARTRTRRIETGDLVLVHVNTYLGGLFTDITRTYVVGPPDDRQRAIFAAVFAARQAALAAIGPGAAAVDVDAAARRVLDEHGLGQYFTHGVGHNVGFSAISTEFPPRLHPVSPDVLDTGSTFNIEPAVYIPGWGGIRHCDVVTAGEAGAEVLTDFQASLDALVVGA
ncbi:MAG TPA: M24 family metallopeptidase [Chloroflexota bacterium]|nr:M24 family metallopeptidase [Chloroflexota bacterium]